LRLKRHKARLRAIWGCKKAETMAWPIEPFVLYTGQILRYKEQAEAASGV
jgi:hypothetical protein